MKKSMNKTCIAVLLATVTLFGGCSLRNTSKDPIETSDALVTQVPVSSPTPSETVYDTPEPTEPAENICDHQFADWEILTAAACDRGQTEIRKCRLCGYCESREIGAPLGHVFGEAVSVPPTCVSAGGEARVCSVCGAVDMQYFLSSERPAGHQWDREQCGCTESRSCTVCGFVDEERGHHYVLVSSDPQTCESNEILHYVCSECGAEMHAEGESASGHIIDTSILIDEKTDPDNPCLLLSTFSQHCSVCGKEITVVETGEKHTYQMTVAKEATCREEGIHRYSCVYCDAYLDIAYTDENAHNFAFCGSDGSVALMKCTNPGCSAEQRVMSSDGKDVLSVDNSLLQSADGLVEIRDTLIHFDQDSLADLSEVSDISVRSVSGDEIARKIGGTISDVISGSDVYDLSVNGGAISSFSGTVTVTVPYTLKGSNPDNVVAMHIDDDGNVSYIPASYRSEKATFSTTHFSMYSVTELPPEKICELYGHTSEVLQVLRTCTEDGYTLVFCTRCGYSETQYIDSAVGHNWVSYGTLSPKCLGLEEQYQCAVCGEFKCIYEPAIGHVWEERETIPASCFNYGEIHFCCPYCYGTRTEYLPLLEHDFVTVEIDHATCLYDGYRLNRCKECGAEQKEIIPAVEHNYLVTDHIDCNGDDYRLYSCEFCGHTYSEPLPPISHQWVLAEETVPDCNNSGSARLVCSRCGEEKTLDDRGFRHFPLIEHVDAGCSTDGFDRQTCVLCGAVLNDERIPALGHRYYYRGTHWSEDYSYADFMLTCLRCGETRTVRVETEVTSSNDRLKYRIYEASLSIEGREFHDSQIYYFSSENEDGNIPPDDPDADISVYQTNDEVWTVRINRYEGSILTIPSEWEGHTVTSVEWMSAGNLKKLVIPDSIESISRISSYPKLSEVIVNPGNRFLKSENGVLYSSDGKELLLFPANHPLTSFAVPEGVEIIRENAFANARLVSVTLPSSLKSIGRRAFYYCSSLESVSFSNGLETIGESAFEHCESLQALQLPDSVTAIGTAAFQYCGRGCSVVLPAGVRVYEADSFRSFGFTEETFDGCSFVIPEGAERLCSHAFADIGFVKWIVLPSTLKQLDECCLNAVDEWSVVFFAGNRSQWDAIQKDHWNALSYDPARESEINVCFYSSTYQDGCWHFADGKPQVWSTPSFAFKPEYRVLDETEKTCALTRIPYISFLVGDTFTVPSVVNGYTVAEIASGAFGGYDENTIYTEGRAGWYFDGKNIVIPPTVKVIEGGAFNMSRVARIELPEGLTKIGYGAFSGCREIKEMTIPGSVEVIEGRAFEMCSSLETLILEEGCRVLEYVEDFSSLKHLTVPSTMESIDSSYFVGNDLEDVTITGDNDVFFLDNGCLYQRNDIDRGVVLLKYLAKDTAQTVRVREDTVKILKNAFEGDRTVETIILCHGCSTNQICKNCPNLKQIQFIVPSDDVLND